MFNLEEKYRIDKRIAVKDFVPKEVKPEVKKKIRESVQNVVLAYQIMGEEIPSIIDDTYHYEVIQFFDFELTDLKKAQFIATMYQGIIKSPCVIRLHDTVKEVYSVALKRLSQTDKTQIVVTDSLLTEPFQVMLPDYNRDELLETLSYSRIVNKENKVAFYLEIYVKSYILMNDKVYSKAKLFLSKPIWYDENKVRRIYALLKEVAGSKEKLLKVSTTSEKMKLNQEIRQKLAELDTL